MHASEVIFFFSNGILFANRSVSFAVEMCNTCSLVPCFLANPTAKEDDFQQPSSLLMFGCSVIGTLSPYFALAFSRFALMVFSSSQCVAIREGNLEKKPSRTLGSSTRRLPVELPMNIFRPQTLVMSVFNTSSRLSLDAPTKKE